MVGWGEHEVVLDERWFRVFCVRGGWGLKFLSDGETYLWCAES